MLFFSTKQRATEGATAFDDVDRIWAWARAAHDRAACRPPTAITLDDGEACDAENLVSTSCVRWT